MTATAILIVSGLGLVLVTAILIGLLLSERESQQHAWRRIAAERRRNHEQRQWLRDVAHRRHAHTDGPLLEDTWDRDDE